MFKAHNIGYFFYNGGNDSADTAYKISQISEKLGYVSIHTFSKAFRKTYGISPSEYQRLLGIGAQNEQQP